MYNDNYRNEKHFLFNEAEKLLGKSKPKFDITRFFWFFLLPVLAFIILTLLIVDRREKTIFIVPEGYNPNFVMREV